MDEGRGTAAVLFWDPWIKKDMLFSEQSRSMLVASESDKTKSWNKYLMLVPVRPLLAVSSHGKQDKTDLDSRVW